MILPATLTHRWETEPKERKNAILISSSSASKTNGKSGSRMPMIRHNGSRRKIGILPLQGHIIRRYTRSEEHTSELQSRENLVCRLLLENKYNLYYSTL